MQKEVIISGFGGQGVLFIGKLLAYTGLDEKKEVTWIPSYGPEMRGGTANCTVIISDEEIGSPNVKNPTAVIAMNLPSLDKYENMVKPGGVLVVNASMVNREVNRDDILVVSIPANDIAEELGSMRSANMVMLGALIGSGSIDMRPEDMKKTISETTKKTFLKANLKAFDSGFKAIVS